MRASPLFSLVAAAAVHADSCFLSNSTGDSGNATVPGMQFPGSSSGGGTWTFGTDLGGNDYGTDQYFTLQADPPIDIASENLPFHGCIAAFDNFPRSSFSRGLNDKGDCMTFLSSDCVSALIDQATQLARQYSKSGDPPNCRDFGNTVPSACMKLANSGLIAGNTLGGSTGNFIFKDATSKPHTCVASPSDRAIIAYSGYVSSNSNWTYYDDAVLRTVPLLTVTWEKKPNMTEQKTNPWTDTRLVCLRPSNIPAGHRIPALPSAGNRFAPSFSNIGITILSGFALAGLLG